MKTPCKGLVSIIVPIYKVEPYLRRCLDSLIDQTYANLEIICVDDGSPDGCPAIVDEYAAKDSRIVAIHQENQGLAGARNSALDVMRGEWVTGVDSDDYLEPNAIEKLLSVADDDTDIVWFGIRVITDEGEKINPYYEAKQLGKHKVTPAILSKTNVNFCAKLWRTELIHRLGMRFIPELWYEDNYFFYVAAPHARHIYYLEDKLYGRIIRDDSIMGQTKSKQSPKCLDQLRIREKIFQHYRKNGVPKVLGSAKPTPFELWLFLSGFFFSRNFTPKSMAGDLARYSWQLINKFGLMRYKLELAGHLPHTPFSKLFVRYKKRDITYKFFGIPFARIHVVDNMIVRKLFGICVSKKVYADPLSFSK